ncbi:DUF4312 family protein [Spiroplasma sp. DGKH1]|uniref:DUF4312 family protein n=1 Tax=Spiroplasma sp. DGKH1 TaxID=3050074 RepID=UPI0034C6240C
MNNPEDKIQSSQPSLINTYQQEDKSILKIEETDLIVTGKGLKIREAYNNAFEEMKKLAYKKFNNFIIHLEPLDVVELSDNSELKSQRFLGTFFPHKKLKYEIKLKIIVRAKYLEIF